MKNINISSESNCKEDFKRILGNEYSDRCIDTNVLNLKIADFT